MVDDTFIYSLPLSALPLRTRRLLSSRLNPTKVIRSDGPGRLLRDWRGLASLVNISSQDESYIQQQCEDKTAKVLEYWQHQDITANVGHLLLHLETIDRFDVQDDVVEDLRSNVSNGQVHGTVQRNNLVNASTEGDEELITNDDRPGRIQIYDAVVLYAEEDKEFVEKMKARMATIGFQMCTVDDLQVGHSAQYAPMMQLISERCLRIIMVLSPAFFTSNGTRFYADYAQANSIESRQRKLIPIIYRECNLPPHFLYYHRLVYSNKSGLVDFWGKLRQTLELAREYNAQSIQQQNRLLMPPQQSPLVQFPSSHSLTNRVIEDGILLPSNYAVSTSALDSIDTNTHKPITTKKSEDSRSCHSQVSDNSVIKKKKSYFRKLFNFGKKTKKSIMVAG